MSTNLKFCKLVGIDRQIKIVDDFLRGGGELEIQVYPTFTEDNNNFKKLFFLRFEGWGFYLPEMITEWHSYYHSQTLQESFINRLMEELQSEHVDDDWKQTVIQKIQEQDWQV